MYPCDPFFLVNLPFTYAINFFFLCGQNAGTYPDTLEYSFFFVPPKKRGNIPRDCIPFPIFSCKLAVYIDVYTFSFCVDRMPRRFPNTLCYSFFFVPPKKNESRKRRPPETPIPLRMPVMAKWAKLAALKQTPIFNAMPFILIVRQAAQPVIPVTGRLGNKCKQLQIRIC